MASIAHNGENRAEGIGPSPVTAMQETPNTPLSVAAAPRKSKRRNIKVSPLHAVLLLVLLTIVIAAIFAPWVAPHDPVKNSLTARLVPPAWSEGGSMTHLLGTDQMGRDLLSRIIYGGRISLIIATVGSLLGAALGAGCGLIAGYARGRIDAILMVLVDAFVALPFVILALAFIAIFGTSLQILILIAILSGFAGYTRITRGLTLQTREHLYVVASRSIGASNTRIMLRHLLPNVLAPIIVLTTMEMSSIILLEASLSFLGFGIQPPTPAWGLMVSEGRDYLHTAWWIGLFPGLAIMLLALSISLLGDWLRDILDPSSS